jgi:hypothetical protein
MDWIDYEFVADVPPDTDIEQDSELTGWECVIFELDDDENLEP